MWMVSFMVLLMTAGFAACKTSKNNDSVPEVEEADENLTLPAYELE